MSPLRNHPGARRLAVPVLLFYGLALLGGLGLLVAVRAADRGGAALVLVAATVAGTLLGQLFALHGLRLWAALAGTLLGALLASPGMAGHLGLAWAVFVPASLCGYLALSERLGLLSFWFPAVLWMVPILERDDGRRLAGDGESALLLGGLTLLFLGFLKAREERRQALWRRLAGQPVSTVQQAAVLREAPARQLARAGWSALLAGLTCGLTAWVAPHLFRLDGETRLAPRTVAVAGRGAVAAGLPCCREATEERQRIREYLDLVRPRVAPPQVPGLDCADCTVEAVPIPVAAAPIAAAPRPLARPIHMGPLPVAGGAPLGSQGPSRSWAPPVQPHRPVPSPRPAPAPRQSPPPVAQAIPPAPPPSAAPAPPPASAPVATPSPRMAAPRPTVVAPPRPLPEEVSLLPWLLTLLAALGVYGALQLTLRPWRRALALRHLRRPLWAETVDQRVSNLWHLALVGLRDAGFHRAGRESPRAFAARVGVSGVAECATILERARHGLGLDQGDLAAMEAAALDAYRSARRHLGPVARAASWLRWPLA